MAKKRKSTAKRKSTKAKPKKSRRKSKKVKRKPSRSFDSRWYSPGSGPASSEKVFIKSAELRTLIVQQLGRKLSSNLSLHLADNEYYCPPLANAKEIITNSEVNRNTWVEEKFDCDDFAHVLKGHFAEAAYKNGDRRKPHCFGIVWGSLPDAHAINWMVTDDLKLRFIEPQDDRIFLPRRTDKDIYFMLG